MTEFFETLNFISLMHCVKIHKDSRLLSVICPSCDNNDRNMNTIQLQSYFICFLLYNSTSIRSAFSFISSAFKNVF